MTAILSLIIATAMALPDPPPEEKPLTKADCEKLVEQLASEFERPFTELYVRIPLKNFPESKLRKRQAPIADAYNKLSANIEVALPVLIDHFDDKRFSYVYEVGPSAVYRCETVGGSCSMIVGHHIGVYRRVVSQIASDEFGNSDNEVEKKLWKKRPDRSLAQLQLERIEWALRQQKPDCVTKDKWATIKRELNEMVTTILDSNAPILIQHQVQFFGK